MDAKKNGIRINPEHFLQDQKRWVQEKEPYWKYQQSIKPGTNQDDGKTSTSRSMEPSEFILDVLVNVGSGFLKYEVDGFKSRLQVYREEGFNVKSNSRNFDDDLSRPYNEARRWTRDEKDKTEELDLIAATVEECLERFMKMIAKNIDS